MLRRPQSPIVALMLFALSWPAGLAAAPAGPVAAPKATAAAGGPSGSTNAQLRGVLLDSEGLPAEGYQVALRSDAGDLFMSAPTGSDGAFALETVPPGGYRLAAFAPDGTEFPVLSRKVVLKAGQTERLEIRIGRKGAAPGRATKGASRAPKAPAAAAASTGGGGVSTFVVVGIVVAGAFAIAALAPSGSGGATPVSPSAP